SVPPRVQEPPRRAAPAVLTVRGCGVGAAGDPREERGQGAERRVGRARELANWVQVVVLGRTGGAGHNSFVAERVRKLLAELTQRPLDERAELVHELARTLPEDHDGEDLDVDYDELDRRREEVENGAVTVVPWSKVQEKWRTNT